MAPIRIRPTFNAVHADVVADAQRCHPGDLLIELVTGGARHKLAEHFHRQHAPKQACASTATAADGTR